MSKSQLKRISSQIDEKLYTKTEVKKIVEKIVFGHVPYFKTDWRVEYKIRCQCWKQYRSGPAWKDHIRGLAI